MTRNESFRLGWRVGCCLDAELSPRQIAAEWPDAHCDSFVQGMADGMALDTFRLRRIVGDAEADRLEATIAAA